MNSERADQRWAALSRIVLSRIVLSCIELSRIELSGIVLSWIDTQRQRNLNNLTVKGQRPFNGGSPTTPAL